MNIPMICKVLCLSALSITMGLSHAAQPQAGKLLTTKELAVHAAKPSVKLGAETLKVVSVRNVAKGGVLEPVTLVVNQQGLVGESRNAVVVSQTRTALVRQQIPNLASIARTVKYYDHMNLTELRFDSFNQAISARSELLALMPKAQVSVPIEYAPRRPR